MSAGGGVSAARVLWAAGQVGEDLFGLLFLLAVGLVVVAAVVLLVGAAGCWAWRGLRCLLGRSQAWQAHVFRRQLAARDDLAGLALIPAQRDVDHENREERES